MCRCVIGVKSIDQKEVSKDFLGLSMIDILFLMSCLHSPTDWLFTNNLLVKRYLSNSHAWW